MKPPVCYKNEENPTRGVKVKKIRKGESERERESESKVEFMKSLNNLLKGSWSEKKVFYGTGAEASAPSTTKKIKHILLI